MEPIAGRKLHVAPLARAAIDHYLDHLGRPSLLEQARHMAETLAQSAPADIDIDTLQKLSMESDESW